MRKKKPDIRFEITRSDPEKTPERLAIKLAEAFNSVALFERQAVDFKRQAHDERRKAIDIEAILVQLNTWRQRLAEDKKNGVDREISRMEPMLTYDPDALQEQLVQHKADIKKFTEMSDDFIKRAVEGRRDINTLQADIREANAAKNKKK
jgi:hypothetical protein